MDTCEILDRGTHLVVVNRNPARRNALSSGFYTGLRAAMTQAAAQPRIGALVLTGAEGFFCAGGDLSFLVNAGEMSSEERAGHITDLADLVSQMLDCPRPLIAAVEGGAAGAGFSLAFACDLIVAAEDARFTASYVNAGLVPDGGLTGSLLAALAPALAAELCLGGAPILARRLADLGAINAAVPAGAALGAAEAMAARLATGPAAAQASIKQLLTAGRRLLMDRQLAAEVGPMAEALGSDEAAEGIAAFLAKRAARFGAMRRS